LAPFISEEISMISASNFQRRASASLMVPTKETALGGQSVLSVWDTYVELGDAAYRNGHADVALMMLKAALKEANHPAEDDDRLCDVLFRMAYVYHQQKRYKKSEVLLKRSLETAEHDIGKSDMDLCPILDLLAESAAAEGRLEKAERYYKRSLAIARRAHGRKDGRTARWLLNLMALYKSFGRLPEASICKERARELDPNCLTSFVPPLSA
ncbi:MAG: tetratricopeptide repeat protein, partial [Terriglobales bacterium]